MRVRSLLLNGTLLIASIAAALLAAEAVVRLLLGLGMLSDGGSIVFPEGSYLGNQRLSANKILIFENDTNSPLINDDGFRDHDYPVIRQEKWRIMTLGDSVTFGRGVPLEDSYPKVLERLLNDESHDGQGFEVMNVAVGGYNSGQELELYRTVGRKYQPDLLIVGFVLNDCHPASLLLDHWAKLRKMRESAAASENDVPTDAPTQSAFREFIGLPQLTKMLHTLIEQRDEERPGAPLWILRKCVKPKNWAIVRHAFRDLAKITTSDGTPVVVVIFPMFYDFEKYPLTALHHRVQAEAQANGFQVLDLFSAFANLDPEGLRTSLSDLVHPNEEGHRVAALRIHEFLVERNLLPR